MLLLPQVCPQVEVPDEIRFGIDKPRVHLRGRVFLVCRPFTRIDDRQSRRDDDDVACAPEFGGLHDHAREPRVDWQRREFSAQWRETRTSPLREIERAEFFKQSNAVLNLAAIRRFDERKPRDVAEVESGHPQDDRG